MNKETKISELGNASDDLYMTLNFCRLNHDTRNQILKECCPIISYCLKQLEIGSKLDEARKVYAEMLKQTKEDIIDSIHELAEIFENVSNELENEENEYEVGERFESEILSTLTLEQKRDKPMLRLMFSQWLDTEVREGRVDEEIASICGQPIECH